MSSKRRLLRHRQNQKHTRKTQGASLSLNVLRTVLAVSAGLLIPWGGNQNALAANSTITRVNDPNTNLVQKDGTGDIYAESASNTVGLNRFDRFEVGKNDIANMYFRTKDNTKTLDTLVNTVNNKIEVQGTVNAIRDNKIGGNLYFLSPKGMVVGADGVINAGSLTVISTQQLPGDASEAAQAVTGIKNNEYPVSSSLDAASMVNGTINAATGIDLRAASIEVSQAEGSTNAPALRTGMVFETVVNNDKVTNAAVKEGRLTASLDKEGHVVIADPNEPHNEALMGDGGIYLRASADIRNDKTKFLGLKTYDNTVTAKATVGEGATIDAIGNVEISSNAQLSNKTKFEHWWYFMGFTKAETTVNGSVSGANVNITSQAKTNYSFGNYANLLDIINEGSSQIGVQFNSNFTNMLWGKLEENGALADSVGGGVETLNSLLTQLYMPFNITDAKATTTIGKTANMTSHILKDAQGNPLTSRNSKGELTDFTSSLNVSASSSAKNTMKEKLQPKV